MPDLFALMPLLMTLVLFAAAAFISKSFILGAAAMLLAGGYVSVRSGNTVMVGFYALSTFFMTMGVAVYLTQTVMGETA